MTVAIVSKGDINIPVSGQPRRLGSTLIVNSMALELLNYGIVPEQRLLDRMATHTEARAHALCVDILKMHTIGDLNPPLFAGWESRTKFTFGECVVQIFGYMLQLSGNDLADPSFMANLKDRVEFKDAQTLNLATDYAALERFRTLVNSNVSLDKKSQSDLVTLAKEYHRYAPHRVRSAEARIAVVLGAVQAGEHLGVALPELGCDATDVLRYAAVVANFEGVKLPSDVVYANLGWSYRLALMRHLSSFDFDDLCEAMGNNREAWYRFFRHFHVLQQKEFRTKFTKVVAAAFVSVGSKLYKIPRGPVGTYVLLNSKFYDITDSGNIAYRTFASRVQSAVDNKNLDALKEEISNKPGYLFRNLGSLSNVCTRRTESEFVELVRSMIDKPKTSVLLSIVQIDVNADYRIIDSKGNTTVTEAGYSPVIGEIQGLAEREIFRRHGFEGRVVFEDHLEHKVVPFLSTNADLDRGTKIPFEDANYLYLLMHWVQRSGSRTDLDHSFICIDSEWDTETIFFSNQANDYISQSGDIINAPAPNGATEYGRISLERLPKNLRYIVPIINVYSGDVFSDNDTAYAGFMFSDNPEFSIQRDHVRYDLTQPANSNIPFIIDVVKHELIIVDFNNRLREGRTAHSSIDNIKKIISALSTKKFMTISRFAEMLSGDGDQVSLTITDTPSHDGPEIYPDDLSDIVS